MSAYCYVARGTRPIYTDIVWNLVPLIDIANIRTSFTFSLFTLIGKHAIQRDFSSSVFFSAMSLNAQSCVRRFFVK